MDRSRCWAVISQHWSSDGRLDVHHAGLFIVAREMFKHARCMTIP